LDQKNIHRIENMRHFNTYFCCTPLYGMRVRTRSRITVWWHRVAVLGRVHDRLRL